MRRAISKLDGWKTVGILGSALILSLGLLVWNNFDARVLTDVQQAALEGVLATSLTGLGLRFATKGPIGGSRG